MDRQRSSKFLLLDTRDKEEYDRCHIRDAVSYPIAMLCRTANELLPQIHKYKNAEVKWLVLYDYEVRDTRTLGFLLLFLALN